MAGVTKFSQRVADEICERLSDGASLREVCEAEGMPARSTVFKWLSENAAFSDQYARAREAQADAVFDEILTIADDGRNDWLEQRGDDGEVYGWRENGEALRRSALRIDARKWMASKLKPKKYGEKVEQTLVGADGGPVKVEEVRERFASRMARLAARSGASQVHSGDADR